MAKWSDILTLISVAAPEEETDDHGFFLPGAETSRDVFANRASVGYSEFYKSQQAGVTALLKMTVRSDEYNGESYAETGGKRYKVLRTYETKSGEFTELTLTDLPERGAPGESAGEGGDADGQIQ